MRKIIVSEHVSLDGFLAAPEGEMDWIKLDDAMFDMVGAFTNTADAALYGGNTYGMMQAYWPTAADQPNATKHDREHSAWYKRVTKYVVSKNAPATIPDKTVFLSDNIPEKISALKQQPGANILVFGSPSVVHLLAQHRLVDEYWIFLNPVILGSGIPMFLGIKERISLTLMESTKFSNGVVALHYSAAK